MIFSRVPEARTAASRAADGAGSGDRLPGFLRDVLDREGLRKEFAARQNYQQDDYLRWITETRCLETRSARIRQMLRELRRD